MELKIVHFYPDLMNLYGSYANVAVLKRYLEELGNTVTVETVAPSSWAPAPSGGRRPPCLTLSAAARP